MYDRRVSRSTPLVDEVANELATWPGVRIERDADETAVVRYEQHELGILYRERGRRNCRSWAPSTTS